jgi:hypothetical protein
VKGQVRPEEDVGGDVREHGVRLLQIAEHQVAEDMLAVAGLVARVGSRFGTRGREIHELLRGRHRERPQQHLVEQREDRGVCADAQRERQDRHGGDKRCLEQPPDGQLQVGHDPTVDEFRPATVDEGVT